MLDYQIYDSQEHSAKQLLPNRIIEACGSELFTKVGYPVSVSSNKSLQRFFDVMHENRGDRDYVQMLNGFTPDEFELYKTFSTSLADMSESLYGRRLVPKGALIRAIFSSRLIIKFIPKGSTILEIGPGSGYLGAVLAHAGYKYIGTDVTQAFYLHQNLIWSHLHPGRVIELATDERMLSDFEIVEDETILHVPWWKFTVCNPDKINLNVDAVVANHVLAEMSFPSMLYSIKLAHQVLDHKDDGGVFFIEGAGGDALREKEDVFANFVHNSFSVAFNSTLHDGSNLTIFTPVENTENTQEMDQSTSTEVFDRAIKLINLRSILAVAKRLIELLLEPSGIRKIKTRTADYFSGRGSPAFLNPMHNSTNESISTYMAAYEEVMAPPADNERVSLEELKAFQKEIVKGEVVQSDDEVFMEYVYGKDRHY